MRHIETVSLCPVCASEAQSFYEERPDGVYLCLECGEHGRFSEKAERDTSLFLWMYEQDYASRAGHLVIPITYRCNMNCRYCYTLSNSGLEVPQDRPVSDIVDYSLRFSQSTNLIGGEPTVRDDLPDIIRSIKGRDGSRVLSISTNGQKLAELDYVRMLKDSGLDYVFLSLNHVSYEPSRVVHQKKAAALDNCLKAGMPVWLQRTVNSLGQLDDLTEIVKRYRKVIFNLSVRSVKPYGIEYPRDEVYVSDMLRYLKKEGRQRKGSTPFNCHVRISGRKTKLCSWVNDVRRTDLVDYGYVISSGGLTTFHRGMKTDEVLLKTGGWKKG